MKVRNYLVGALAALVTLVSCQKEVEQLGFPKLTVDTDVITFGVKGGSQSIAVTSTRDWTADCSAEWLVISPEKGTYSMDPQPIKITVLENNGYDREATLKITINMTEKNVTIKQDGVKGSTEQLVLFYNNFDKEEATQTYGSGTSWPFLDQFEGWKNETGSGAANVTYSFKAVSARANSTSNSNYSDYEGSGSNNMFFGSNAYIAVKNIALNGNKDLKLTFGTEKYSQSLGSVFTPSEYHIYLSKDGSKWVELKDYTFAGGETEGRWNVATATFTVPSGTENLSICMKVDVASSYRMDDFKLEAATEAGTAVDFSKAVDMNFSDGTTGGGNEGGDTPGGEVTPPAGDYIYFNNYDKVVATKTNNKWPFLDQFEGWKNETGSGAANVTYTFSGISARANAESNGTYSDYTSASGKNNLFFGENAYIATRNIALNGAKDLVLTFVSEKSTYNNDAESVFKQSEFHIYLSNDGSKWVELTDYTFAGGDTPGRWNLATATFSVPANTANLSIAIKADVASVYRLDDLGLAVATTAGTAVDFSNAVDMDFGSDSTGGGNEGGDTPGGEVTPPAGPVTATVKEFLAAAEDDTWYKLTGTISNLTNTTFGNFNLVDETGTVLVYGLTKTQVDKNDQSFSQLGLKEGDVVTLIGKRTAFQGTPQVGGPAYYVSHEPGNEGGTTPPEGGDEGTTDSYEPSGITWTLGTNAYDNTKSQSATVNGKKVTNLLKLGKSKAGGTATMKIPAGTKKVGAYILAWKGNNNITLDFTVGGTAVAPQFTAKANAGATGNAPYTITLDETYYHEIEVNTTADVEVLLTSSERVLLIGLKAIK